jgi:hypothetical protein
LVFTVALAILLIVPLVTRVLTNTEPYPAILLPSGATKIAVRARAATFDHVALYAGDSYGRFEAIDARTFLAPIPVQYLEGITATDFGQTDTTTKRFLIRRVGAYAISRRVASEKDRRIARDWLRDRVRLADTTADHLVTRVERTTLDLDNDQERTTPLHETAISLR